MSTHADLRSHFVCVATHSMCTVGNDGCMGMEAWPPGVTLADYATLRLMIVPVPDPSVIVEPDGFDSTSVNVSLASAR